MYPRTGYASGVYNDRPQQAVEEIPTLREVVELTPVERDTNHYRVTFSSERYGDASINLEYNKATKKVTSSEVYRGLFKADDFKFAMAVAIDCLIMTGKLTSMKIRLQNEPTLYLMVNTNDY